MVMGVFMVMVMVSVMVMFMGQYITALYFIWDLGCVDDQYKYPKDNTEII